MSALQPLSMSVLCHVSKVPRRKSVIAGSFPASQPALFGVDVNNKDRDWCCAAQELMSELHNTLGSSSAGRGNDDDSEDDDHEVTERLDRPAHADRPASAQHAEEGGEDDDESGEEEEEEEEEGADARKLERGS